MSDKGTHEFSRARGKSSWDLEVIQASVPGIRHTIKLHPYLQVVQEMYDAHF